MICDTMSEKEKGYSMRRQAYDSVFFCREKDVKLPVIPIDCDSRRRERCVPAQLFPLGNPGCAEDAQLHSWISDLIRLFQFQDQPNWTQPGEAAQCLIQTAPLVGKVAESLFDTHLVYHWQLQCHGPVHESIQSVLVVFGISVVARVLAALRLGQLRTAWLVRLRAQ